MMYRYLFLTFLSLSVLIQTGCQSLSPDTSGLNERDRITRLQIFLDEHNFGPGKIDGSWGTYTEKARLKFSQKYGIPPDSQWERKAGVASVYPIYTTYQITEQDRTRIGFIADTPEEQSKQRSMPYTSLAEFVAERYHTTVSFLATLNPNLNINSLKAGDTIRVPNITPFQIEEVAARASVPANPAYAGRRIVVDTKERMLEVLEGDILIAAFPITPGSSALPAPRGNWKIVGIATMPWYRYDQKVLQEGIRSEDFYMIPAGPNSPVGILWMGLNKPGIGIHGTNNPDTIGRAASHGCIRLANWDAIKMVSLVSKGTPVHID